MPERYMQQMLEGDRRVGFRNFNDEPWIMYTTPPTEAVISGSDKGYYPREGWIKDGDEK